MNFVKRDGEEYITVTRYLSAEEKEKDKDNRSVYKIFILLEQMSVIKQHQDELLHKIELMMEGLDFDFVLPLGGNLMVKIDSAIHIRKYWEVKGVYYPKKIGVCFTISEFKALLMVTDHFAERYLFPSQENGA